MLGRLPHQAWLGAPSAADHAAVERAMRRPSAWDWRDRPLGSLSGGERQRVLLARALAVRGAGAADGRAAGQPRPAAPGRLAAHRARAVARGRHGGERAARDHDGAAGRRDGGDGRRPRRAPGRLRRRRDAPRAGSRCSAGASRCTRWRGNGSRCPIEQALHVPLGLDRSHRRAVRLLPGPRFGEPPVRWHPVVWMGKYLGWIGGRIAPREARAGADWRAFSAGALAWYGGAMLVGPHRVSVAVVAAAPERAVAGLLLGVLLKPMFSWRMLRGEVVAVEAALERSLRRRAAAAGPAGQPRRDAAHAWEVRESAIESLAENLNDSVVAPVFWFVVAGLPGAVVYRFANTADAMWGYRGLRAGAVLGMGGQVGGAGRRRAVVAAGRGSPRLLLAVAAGGSAAAHGCDARPRRRRRPTAAGPWPRWRWPGRAAAQARRLCAQRSGRAPDARRPA